MNEGRFETKFVLDEIQLPILRNWINSSGFFSESYPTRRVNSLYFDDHSFSSLNENIAGISDRTKIRLRWYGNIYEEISHPNIEFKIKKNKLGYKKRFDIELSKKLNDMSIDEISRLVCDTLEKNPISLSLSTWPILLPTLGVSYQREYLESSHNIRLTIDTKISFSNAAGVKKLKHLPFSLFPKYVVEFKYLVRNKDDLSKILNTFPFRAVRSSKYVLGSAMHGHVNYV